MPDHSNQRAATALELLADAASRRNAELEKFNTSPTRPDSDEETDPPAPHFDSFYQTGGSAAIHEMSNFTSPEFHKLWTRVSPRILATYNTGCGRRSSFSAKDVLFMAISTAKHAGNWDFMGSMFLVKGPTFERTVTGFLRQYSEIFYHIFVGDVEKHYTTGRLISEKKTFKTFQYARYATDVTFQQSNRPTGNLQESKLYFSGKHKLYEYKVEVSVLPNVLAVGATNHYPGSVADVDIFYKNKYFHKCCLSKTEEEKSI